MKLTKIIKAPTVRKNLCNIVPNDQPLFKTQTKRINNNSTKKKKTNEIHSNNEYTNEQEH